MLEKGARFTPAHVLQMLSGILLIGMGVAAYRVSLFGVDAFSCMNLGVSGFLGWSFGNWQMLINGCILIAVFFLAREDIGLGTVVNMVCVGYVADFLCWFIENGLGVWTGLPLRVGFLTAGTLFAALGCALYMNAELGVSPYDSVAIILNKLAKGKLSFRAARVLSDVTVICIGVGFCLAARNELREIIGLGTIINALCNGPLIQWFRAMLPK